MRIAASEQYRCQPWEILEHWSFNETLQAHRILDWLDDSRPEPAPEPAC